MTGETGAHVVRDDGLSNGHAGHATVTSFAFDLRYCVRGVLESHNSRRGKLVDPPPWNLSLLPGILFQLLERRVVGGIALMARHAISDGRQSRGATGFRRYVTIDATQTLGYMFLMGEFQRLLGANRPNGKACEDHQSDSSKPLQQITLVGPSSLRSLPCWQLTLGHFPNVSDAFSQVEKSQIPSGPGPLAALPRNRLQPANLRER